MGPGRRLGAMQERQGPSMVLGVLMYGLRMSGSTPAHAHKVNQSENGSWHGVHHGACVVCTTGAVSTERGRR